MSDETRDIEHFEVIEALRPVQDPEIGLSIVELGLIYGSKWDPEEHKLRVDMTLTSQMCPMGPEIIASVKMSASQIPGVREVDVELVWSPPWDPKEHCTDDAKAVLGIWD